MKFIHIADVHWGAKPERNKVWGGQREKEIKETFQRILDYARQNETDLLFISGDFFHQPPSYRELREVDYLLGKLKRTKVVWIAGNHDYLQDGTGMAEYIFSSNVFFLKSRQLEKVYFPQWNTTVYGLSYWQSQIREPLYNKAAPTEDEGIRILLAHGGDNQHIPINKETLKWSGFDYIALGHIHKPEIIFEDLMAYAGSPEPLDHTETGAHGFMEGEITEEKQIVSFVPFSKRIYVETEVTVSEDMSGEEILDRTEREIGYRGTDQIHKIVLTGTMDPQVKPDFARIEDKYYISGIEYRTENAWNYEWLSVEDNLLISKVAMLLKDDPKALSYAMEALTASREA